MIWPFKRKKKPEVELTYTVVYWCPPEYNIEILTAYAQWKKLERSLDSKDQLNAIVAGLDFYILVNSRFEGIADINIIYPKIVITGGNIRINNVPQSEIPKYVRGFITPNWEKYYKENNISTGFPF